ncbi:diguanylate cyclase (GGDEF) domain-containing protein [Oceanospirillum multiglobuliferum]|uniref:GGDEF domain-containing protein n=1 Tax=Oceanospirillum multiglobuliferum TaxID=64969 RepID=A0A1T4SI97_9GAMM|nr:sensor domain-containing diguanylate cyclase [Oceanospirillum multiglobuliferum]OPX54228.1 hypothetical protein BTE48_15285 [Oceanospirillum multiglobuliferum]SKA27658.1 diguanylate cyclase (GGDEF) domain-containing protein [Oceanospirillum multiglobuliferum]
MTQISDHIIGSIIAQSKELMLLLDPQSLSFIYSNAAAEKSLGYDEGEICQFPPHQLLPEFLTPELAALLENMATLPNQSMQINTVLISKLAGLRDYSLQMQYVQTDSKRLVLISGADVTERLAETDSIHNLLASTQMDSMLDSVTGLMQRSFFLPHLQAVINEASDNNKAFGLMILDLVNIPEINSQYGQPIGDRVLRHIGQVVKRVVDTPEYAARFSGKKLCLVLPAATKSSVQTLVSHLMRAIGRLSYAETPELKVEARLGIYFGTAKVEPEVLLAGLGKEHRKKCSEQADTLVLLTPSLDTEAAI